MPSSPPDDATASRHHFLLEVNPPAARLRDLGSLNGTYVNGQKHGGRGKHVSPEEAARQAWPQVDLRDGDLIRVGATVINVHIDGVTAAPPVVRDPSRSTSRSRSRTPPRPGPRRRWPGTLWARCSDAAAWASSTWPPASRTGPPSP